MIKVAIVEDSLTDRNLLTEHINKFMQDENVEINCTYFDDGMRFVESMNQSFDVVLMDIEMSIMNGLEAARHLRKVNREVPLIFITNMAQFAIKGYEVEAMGYFLKPVKYPDFYNKFKKAIQIVKTKKDTVIVKIETGTAVLNIADIKYLEVVKNNVTYHTINGDFKTRSTLIGAEIPLMKSGGFARCNNCYLVNLQFVTKVCANIAFVGGDELIISRHKKKEFMDALANYIGKRK